MAEVRKLAGTVDSLATSQESARSQRGTNKATGEIIMPDKLRDRK
jgi:hypothetical protein